MNISGSNNKHPLNPKAYQIIAIKEIRRDKNLQLEREPNDGSGYLREE